MPSESNQVLYRQRLKRVQDAVCLRVPDRVPLIPSGHFFVTNSAGLSTREAMFDHDRLEAAWKKFTLDTRPDMYNNPYRSIGIGTLFETLDAKQYRWPGNGVAPKHAYQFVEGEYMKAEEYDAFLFDPSDYVLRRHLPRMAGAFEGLRNLPRIASMDCFRALTAISNLYSDEFRQMREALEGALAAEKAVRARSKLYDREMEELGFPPGQCASIYAPFDYLGDYFRGTTGIMLDMYRRPDKLLQALDKILHILIEPVLEAGKGYEMPIVFIPLHKGAEGFMSIEQFKRFYWPGLRQTMMMLIEHNMTPFVFFEGYYDSRLEIIGDIPPGKAMYKFEHTDMFRAKEVLGDRVCLRGNVPASLLCTGSPQEVRDYCKKLIDIAGKNGGYIMDGATGLPDEARPENVRAMLDFTREYGVYR